jgi:3-oxoacyl-[acyl-carrier protein] reductase
MGGPDRPLSGQVALVTGAASGIGRASAIRLAADGATLICLDRDLPGALETVTEIEAGDGRALALGIDVTDAPAVATGVEAAALEFGRIDILVNNAGIPGGGRFVDIDLADWSRVLDVHVNGTFHVTKAVLTAMIEAGHGRIINIASESVWLGDQSVQYVTAKAALVGFTRALAHQVAGDGVLVNAVAPGPVATPMLLGGDPADIEAERRHVLIGRFLEPSEIAATIAFLAGPGGEAYVGQVLSPNGGTVFPG